MCILLVSYFAEAHLHNSSAQNTRFLARGLLEQGQEIRVVCAGYKGETIIQDGYPLTKIPLANPQWKGQWLGAWLPDLRIRSIVRETFEEWKPDVLYMGAWGYLSDFVFVAKEMGIPVVQMVHDYSILCLRQWLVDSWGEVCSGPTPLGKCIDCIRHGLGWKDRIKDFTLSLPVLGEAAWPKVEGDSRWGMHVNRVVGEAYSYMQSYRNQIDIFIAQSPAVIEMLKTVGVDPSCCRFVPQYIGEEKLRKYPRAEGTPGVDRPVRLVYVGRWSREKGADLLLDAFLSAEVASKVELWVISKNISAEAIESQVNGRMAAHKTIHVFNDLSGADVSQELARADVCVVPSLNPETGSRVVLEAHAQGVPVIASSTVGNRYVIEDGVNGKLFSSGDVEVLTSCFEKVINDLQVIQEWSEQVYKPISKQQWSLGITKVLHDAINTQQPFDKLHS